MQNINENRELMDIFYAEARGLIDAMRRHAAAALDEKGMRELFRCAHTIKSSAKAVGLTGLEGMARALEKVCKAAKEGTLTIAPGGRAVIAEAVEACALLVDNKEVAGYDDLVRRLGEAAGTAP